MTWSRRRYHVADGYLRPYASSQRREYDPFGTPGEGVHEDLLNLDPNDEVAVADFATRWGPLGLLPHYLVEMRYVSGNEGIIDLDAPDERNEIVVETPVRRSYINGSGEDFNFALGSGFLADQGIQQHDLADYLAPHFPDTPDGPFPSLHSPELWDHMCEPMSGIEREVTMLQSVADLLKQETPERDKGDSTSGLDLLRHQLTRITPSLTYDGTSWQASQHFPSLLSVAYFRLYQDLLGGNTLKRCEADGCGRWFSTRIATKKYCSDEGGNERVRKYRERERAKRAAK